MIAGAGMSESSRAQEVEDSAHAYAALNWRQLTFDGPETLASLVASCDSLFSRIEVNMRELFALLKVCTTLTSEYHIVQANLEEKHADPSNTFSPLFLLLFVLARVRKARVPPGGKRSVRSLNSRTWTLVACSFL